MKDKKQKNKKQYILDLIQSQIDESQILRSKTLKGVWTINELIYCLERIQYDVTIEFSIWIDGPSICVPIDNALPVFVDCKTREKKVKITSIEIYEEDEYSTTYGIVTKEAA